MTSIRKVALACMTAAMMATAVNAGAQGPRNQDTYFTFSQAVELPKTTLPAGTYFFQLMDSDSNRHIVKVMSQDRKELHATLMAIPYYSTDRPSDEPQVRFMETPAGTNGTNGSAAAGTNAVKIWFYPGNTVGHEFIYPRAQAMRIASRTGTDVLTTKSETAVTETVADTDLTRVDRAGTDTAVDMSNRTTDTMARAEQPDPAPAPTPAPTAAPEQTTPAPQPMPERTAEPAPMRERTELPSTASLLPLLALIGIGAMAGSRLIRHSRRA